MKDRPEEAIDLPDGQWALLRKEEEITERNRRVLRHVLPSSVKLQARIEEIVGERQWKRRQAFEATERANAAEAAANGESYEIKPYLPEADEDTGISMAEWAELPPDLLDARYDLRAAHIVVYVKDWSLDLPLPTLDTVIDLPGEVFDALGEATFDKPAGRLDTSGGDARDPDSPTGPSSDSASDSTAPTGASATSTQESSPSGASIGTVDSVPV